MSKAKNRAAWINRTLIISPCIGLCKTEEEFHNELRRLKFPEKMWPVYVPDGFDAKTHMFIDKDKNTVFIICVREGNHERYPLAGLLAHEATHVWQEICECINEDEPSREFEAYSVQHIAQELMQAYGIFETPEGKGKQ